MRGLPGSGKSHVAKLIRVSCVIPANHSVIQLKEPVYVSFKYSVFTNIAFCNKAKINVKMFNFVYNIKDKEVDCGGAPPRVLVLDDYFMTEVEKVEKDPDTGKRVKAKVSLTTISTCGLNVQLKTKHQ